MRFTKMHGAGNDYLYVDCFRQTAPRNPAELARRISDRHTGVGSDGLILVGPSPIADAQMKMFNADGSEAEMCGNGLRCLAKYLFEQGLVSRDSLSVEAGSRVVRLKLKAQAGKVEQVRVDMGEPILSASEIPTSLPCSSVRDHPLEIDGRKLHITALSFGNPHCVVFVDTLTEKLVRALGPSLENHPAFPHRTNVEFVQILSPSRARQRTWERGTGETLACGSGACAVVVAGAITGRTNRALDIELLGGELHVQWRASNNHVYLNGPAVEVFSGEWPDEMLESRILNANS